MSEWRGRVFSRNVGGFDSLDPEGLRGLPYIRTAVKMMTDYQVASVAAAVLLPVRSARWCLTEDDSNPEHAAHLGRMLGLPVGSAEARPDPRWQEFISRLTTAMTYGVSVHEIQVEPLQDRVELAGLHWVQPWRIGGWERDSWGRATAVKVGEETLPLEHAVCLTWDEPQGGPWGVGLLRPAVDPWRRKQDALEVQSLSVRRNGLGIPVYTGPEPPQDCDDLTKWAQDDLDTGLEIASALTAGHSAGVALPHGATLRLAGVDGHLPDLSLVVQQHDQAIARSMLAHLLTLGTQTGSWALGTQFTGLLGQALQDYATQVGAAVQSLVDRLCYWSWGDVPAPRVTWSALDRSAQAVIEAVTQLSRVGAVQPSQDTEQALRDMLGLPDNESPISGLEDEVDQL